MGGVDNNDATTKVIKLLGSKEFLEINKVFNGEKILNERKLNY